ncbi:MAG: hypothetical protein IKZ88_02660 [Neisseriaceae bacterium]|nr:hypothetical protein [Neisseriaceae bacterium]
MVFNPQKTTVIASRQTGESVYRLRLCRCETERSSVVATPLNYIGVAISQLRRTNFDNTFRQPERKKLSLRAVMK